MARKLNKVCQHCASLSVEEAIALHGEAGDNCWNPEVCHRRRSHYRHRDDNNAIRRRLRKQSQQVASRQLGEPLEITLPEVPIAPAAVLVLYRQQSDTPVHAVAAEVWQGSQKVAEIKPVHCMGMRADRVSAYIKSMLASLNQQFAVSRFEDVIKEIPVDRCPIENCPLKSPPSYVN